MSLVWLRRLIDNLTGRTFAEEYYLRFLHPQRERLRMLDVQEADIDRLWKYACHLTDVSSGQVSPGLFLRNFADHIEAGGTVESLLPDTFAIPA